ncbi:olfactory receptor 10A2-like [Emydura macquarii macquarii]|uniref:olfactory receptor 10A2-like n=1 Tax=Emydura macquarii macquarii TaxID=1129001 RepID=UPI00352A702A
MVGNSLVMVLIVADQNLHSPMYFFLGNFSCQETCYTSTILPRLLASFLTGNRTISVSVCFTQMYFFGVLATPDCYLLTAVSYDQYLAICKHLHYSALMSTRSCLFLASGSWLRGWFATTIFTLFILHFKFCGPNEIDHFYCDVSPMMKLCCGDKFPILVFPFMESCIFTLLPFLLTLISYVCIITSILRIPSVTMRQKAFSTCSSRLIMVTIFYVTLMIVYIISTFDTLRMLKKVFLLCYTVLTPLVNPLIYSLRNREAKEALSKALNQYVAVTLRQKC